jgi:glutathione S-transferase
MALAHKGLEVETIPWRFTEKAAIAKSGQGSVPVVEIDGQWIADSWTIAEYLEGAFTDAPSLFGGDPGRALARFHNSWSDAVLVPGIFGLIALDIYERLAPQDRAYFRSSRESRIGMTLEAFAAGRDDRLEVFRKSLQPMRQTLKAQTYLGGEAPHYADYAVFGPLQWARCISPYQILEQDDRIWEWRERLLDLFGGLARSVPAYN